MSLFLHENHELNMLLVNTLQRVREKQRGFVSGWVRRKGEKVGL